MASPKYPNQYDDTQDTTPPYLATPGEKTSIQDLVSRLRASILAIEHELGIKPSGTDATVSQRLDLIEAGGGGGTGTEIDIPLTFYGTTAIGDVVYVIDDTAAKANTALANFTQCSAIGVAVSSDTVRIIGVATVKAEGTINIGDAVFLSTATPGTVTTSVSLTGGTSIVYMGVATTAASGGYCQILLQIEPPEYNELILT